MFNELARLNDCSDLFTLLSHYADLGKPDRQIWQDRRMSLDGCDSRQLTSFHGELIAYGWLEQNTCEMTAFRRDEAPGCYRITPSGVRAVKAVKAGEIDE